MKITHFHPSRNNRCDNYCRNRPFKTLKYAVFYFLCSASLELPISNFFSVEVQFLLLKSVSQIFLMPVIFSVVLSQSLAFCNLWPGIS